MINGHEYLLFFCRAKETYNSVSLIADNRIIKMDEDLRAANFWDRDVNKESVHMKKIKIIIHNNNK